MYPRYILIISLLISSAVGASAQRIDIHALSGFSPSLVTETYQICQYVSLTPIQQRELAEAYDKVDREIVSAIESNEGFLSDASRKRTDKMRETALREILTHDQLCQYYRAVYNAEAVAEGVAMANTLQKKYNLTDQNWKFIRNAFHKIGLESRVIKKVMESEPKKANAAIERLRAEQLQDIEDRGGIRVDPKKMTVEIIRPFNKHALRKQ